MNAVQNTLGRGFLFFLLFIVVWSLAFKSTLSGILTEWLSNGPYSHGLMALAVSCYFIWQKRNVFNSAKSNLNLVGVTITLLSGIAWWFASIANVFTVQVICIFVLLNSSLYLIFGSTCYRQLLSPLCILLLVLPIWNVLQHPLQDISTFVSYHVVDILTLPILREG